MGRATLDISQAFGQEMAFMTVGNLAARQQPAE